MGAISSARSWSFVCSFYKKEEKKLGNQSFFTPSSAVPILSSFTSFFIERKQKNLIVQHLLVSHR
jgi:hypothetical protein